MLISIYLSERYYYNSTRRLLNEIFYTDHSYHFKCLYYNIFHILKTISIGKGAYFIYLDTYSNCTIVLFWDYIKNKNAVWFSHIQVDRDIILLITLWFNAIY